MRRAKSDLNLTRLLRELRQAAMANSGRGRSFFRVLRRYVQARCRTA
ncbi:MAG: hypothetical protein K6T86_04420 [Pirellulales bacterium]|nr:hypothetical protein [Pirellulales bacterium]